MRYSDEAIRLRSEYIQKPLAATDVNQATLCVHKQVIRVAASLNGMRHSAVPKVEGGKLRWMPKHGQDLLTLGIDREREVGAWILRRPGNLLLGGGEIEHRNLVGIGNVYENPTSLRLHLEALGMRFQANVSDLLAAPRVNNGQSTASIADEDTMRVHVDSNIIGVLAKLDRPRGR